jgi:hypothetical protein
MDARCLNRVEKMNAPSSASAICASVLCNFLLMKHRTLSFPWQATNTDINVLKIGKMSSSCLAARDALHFSAKLGAKKDAAYRDSLSFLTVNYLEQHESKAIQWNKSSKFLQRLLAFQSG